MAASHSCPWSSIPLQRRHYLVTGHQARALMQANSRPRQASHAGRHSNSSCRAKAAAAVEQEAPAELMKIVKAFQMVRDPKAKYQQLMFYAKKLPPMPAELHTEENKVRGCVSQVWVHPAVQEDGTINWTADSDSVLVKGLAALLVQGLGGARPEDVVRIPPDFIERLGLQQSLTPSRNNGFLNMFRLMQRKSLQLAHAAGQQAAGGVPADAVAEQAVPGTQRQVQQQEQREDAAARQADAAGGNRAAEVDRAAQRDVGSTADPDRAPQPASSTPLRDAMEQKLTDALQPSELEIIDESSQHAGHAAMRTQHGRAGGGGETHFRVTVVSGAFEGQNTVKRHRQVYQLLNAELKGGVHALSLVTKTPQEVQQHS